MRLNRYGKLAVTLGLLTSAGCGDDTGATTGSGSGGAGGGDGGAATTSAQASTAATSTPASTATAGGDGGSGGGSDCTPLELDLTDFLAPGPFGGPADAELVGPVTPALGGDEADSGHVIVRGLVHNQETTAHLPGDYDLSLELEGDTCEHCVFVFEDDTGDEVGRAYFQESGTLTIAPGAQLDRLAGDFSLSDVVLREVEFDLDTFATTAIDGGACLVIPTASASLGPTTCGVYAGFDDATSSCLESFDGCCDALDACTLGGTDPGGCSDCMVGRGDAERCEPFFECRRASGCLDGLAGPDWTCDPAALWSGEACDCECGQIDPDCFLPDVPVTGCGDGDRCSVLGTCYPEAWTCPELAYADGSICACDCGAPDPDCGDPDALLVNCEQGQTCSVDQICEGIPTTWTCDEAAFGDGVTCDCACGATDSDCDDTGLPVTGCEGDESCREGECVPAGWVCPGDWYGGDENCDCGCGIPDPDCPDGDYASCDFCECDGQDWCDIGEVVEDQPHLCAG